MSAINEAMEQMARSAADALLDGFGSGPLVMKLNPTQAAGIGDELGYVTAYPVNVTLDLVHGRVLGIVAEKKWELIISASEMESAAEDGGYADVLTMMDQCQEVRWRGKRMTVDITEPEAIGDAAYFYRLHVKEIG